jgi:sigma-54 dependent transcriptional regulator, acetoin dehydrogenase operon transcriptional activator AcoR
LFNGSRKGINLDERCIGSSAPSITLAERKTSLVVGDAHFCANLRKFVCAAAPIEAPQGHLLGALDISAYDAIPRFDILALAEDAATAIENSLFRNDSEHVLLRFHVRPEWVDAPRQAIVTVRSDGRIVGANRVALSLLGVSRQMLLTSSFRDLFDRDPNRLFGRWRHPESGLLEMATRSGLIVVGRLECDTEPHRGTTPAPSPVATPPQRSAAGETARAATVRLEDVEMSTIVDTLERLGGNVSKAARQLGVSRNTIYRRLAARAKSV